MNEPRKVTIEDVAAHQKLALEYTTELPPHLTGIADDGPNPKYIALNTSQPQFEQHAFIGYTIGSHHLPRHYAVCPPWYQKLLNRKWRNHYMTLWMRATRRKFHRDFPKQKQGEIFALIMMMNLGYTEDTRLYLEKHPEMNGWAIYAAVVMIARGLKQRLVRFLKNLFTLAIP